jgi:hypothetical protein
MSTFASLRSVVLGAMLALGFCTLSTPAHAANSDACLNGAFSVILPNGQVLSGQNGWKISRSQLPSNSLVHVLGRYIEFDLNVSTFAVYNYALTGAPNSMDLTGGVRTVLFTRKEPSLNGKTVDAGDFEVTLSAPSLELRRQGSSLKMKIQAKDCAQGGVFQMEPETNDGSPIVFTHTVASPDLYYFVNPYTGKVNFGNSSFIRGKDSPQVATRVLQSEFETVWSVASGGRMGGVLGEDAVELSAGASACVQDCQAQNRIHGTVPVTDPIYSEGGSESETGG